MKSYSDNLKYFRTAILSLGKINTEQGKEVLV
jgi:hypothetical protein